MHAKKPQTRQTGGTLAKTLSKKLKQSIKLTAAKKRLLAAKLKPIKKVNLPKNSTKVQPVTETKVSTPSKSNKNPSNAIAKKPTENDKKSKQTSKVDVEGTKPTPTGLNASKEKNTSAQTNKKKLLATNSKSKVAAKKNAATAKDEKTIKSSKELKNLDIQLTGYSSAARESTTSDSDTDKYASICEIVKTKARAASSTFNMSGNRSPLLTNNPNHAQNKPSAATKSATTEKATKNDVKNDNANATPKLVEEKAKKEKAGDEKKKTPAKAPSSVDAKKTDNSDTKKKSTTIIKKGKKLSEDKTEQKVEKKPAETKKLTAPPAKKINKTDDESSKLKNAAKEVEKVEKVEKVTDDAANNTVKNKTPKKEQPSSSIEIKAQIHDSKSLIDTITEAINEVVKQYKDSTMVAENNSKPEIKNDADNTADVERKTVKCTKTVEKPSNTDNKSKIAKVVKKKTANEKKIEKLRKTSESVKNEESSTKNNPKKANKTLKEVKQTKKVEKLQKADTKVQATNELIEKSNSNKTTTTKQLDADNNDSVKNQSDSKASAIDPKSESNVAEKAAKPIPKKPKATSKKLALQEKQKGKLANKDSCESKGSKIIKIDLKTKKKIKPVAKANAALLKAISESVAWNVQKKGKIAVRNIETMKSNATDECKSAESKAKVKEEDISDDEDDDMSLTELKAHLTQSDVKKPTKKEEENEKVDVKELNVDKNQKSDTKTTPASEKQKFNKKKLFTASKKDAKSSTTEQNSDGAKKLKGENDIYDFHESGHSSEDALDFSNKKKSTIQSNSQSQLSKAKDDDKKKETVIKTEENAKNISEKQKISDNKNVSLKKPVSSDKTKKPTPPSNAKCKKKVVASKVNKTKEAKNKKVKKQADNNKSDNECDDDDDDDKDSTYSSRNAVKKSFAANCKSLTDTSDSSSSDNDDNNDSADKNNDTDTSVRTRVNNRRKLAVKNRRMKLFGFYSGLKRHRMASLNALAKVQCLYENESRTAHELGFVKEPQNVQRMKNVTDVEPTNNEAVKESEKSKVDPPVEKKEKKAKITPATAAKNIKTEKEEVTPNNRTLRKVPGVRGEGNFWEMEDSSLDESEMEQSSPLVSI